MRWPAAGCSWPAGARRVRPLADRRERDRHGRAALRWDGAQLGYRKEMKGSAPFMRGLVLPCIVGGSLGAWPAAGSAKARCGDGAWICPARDVPVRGAGADHAARAGNPASSGADIRSVDGQSRADGWRHRCSSRSSRSRSTSATFGAGAGAIMLADFGLPV